MIRNRQDGALSKIRITKGDRKISKSRFESQNLIFFLVIIAQKWDWMHDLYFQSDIREQILD